MLPVARERDFSLSPLYFFNAVVDPSSRTLIRVYGFDNLADEVSVIVTRTNELQAGRTISLRLPLREKPHYDGTAFPSFGSFDLASVLPADILVPGAGPPRFLIQLQPNTQKLWALVTITNNETQHVTAITP